MRLAALTACLILAGCLTPGTSDPSRTWELPRPGKAGPPVKVFLPLELRTPRVVAADAAGAAVARDFDRWGTPLHEGLARLISAELAVGLPVRRVTVEFRTLKVTAGGHYELDASYRLSTLSFEGGPELESEGLLTSTLAGKTGIEDESLEMAVRAYAQAAKTVANRIRSDYERDAKGEVAKPAPAVSVPGE